MIIENVGYIHDDLLGGTRPMTNFEFIQTCTMEELAEFLVEIVCGEELKKHIKERGYINMHSYQTEMREWLKEKHNG